MIPRGDSRQRRRNPNAESTCSAVELLPHAFLFHFSVPCARVADLPKRGTWPIGTAAAPLPLFSALDQGASNVVLRAAWNEGGFGVAAEVKGRTMPPHAKADELSAGDGLHVWIDTRNAQGAHRAGRFCHRFALLPAVGRGKSARPMVAAIEIPRAREPAPAGDLTAVRLQSEVTSTGYRIEAWFPAATLNGYDPENSSRIGFHAVVKDSELGDRSLTVGEDFPTDHDPSLWTTLDLVRD